MYIKNIYALKGEWKEDVFDCGGLSYYHSHTHTHTHTGVERPRAYGSISRFNRQLFTWETNNHVPPVPISHLHPCVLLAFFFFPCHIAWWLLENWWVKLFLHIPVWRTPGTEVLDFYACSMEGNVAFIRRSVFVSGGVGVWGRGRGRGAVYS